MKDLNKRIGQVCLNFSTIELMLSVFTARLVSDDSKIGAIVTSEMSFQNLIKAFESLVRHKDETQDSIQELLILVKGMNQTEVKRNLVINSAYGLRNDDTDIFRIKVTSKRGKGLSIQSEKIDKDYFEKLTREQVEILNELQKRFKELYKTEILKYG